MKIYVFWGIVILITFGACRQRQTTQDADAAVSHVDPFIGTAGHGHTYPGATVPFGMVQVSPDNGKNGWDYSSGYHYPDSTIAGFSMTHLSGTGIGDLCDLSFMPFSGSNADTTQRAVYSTYSHENESAEPGYYSVKLNNGIQVDLTASARAGVYRYHFPDGAKPAISLDLGFAINWDHPTNTYMHRLNDSLIVGYRMSTGWAHDQKVYFAAAFSEPLKKFVVSNAKKIMTNQAELKGQGVQGFFFFDQPDTAGLLQKVAISAVSTDNAMANLKEEVPGWDFNAVRESAQKAWAGELSKIEIQSTDSARLRTFYTALYHTMLAPTLYEDTNGGYRGADRNVYIAEDFTNYSTFSLWDTYRAEHPLLTFIQGDRVDDIIRFMLAFYDEHGLLPVWELKANETNTMIAYHAIPVITDAYFKGYREYDVEKVLEAMKKSANEGNKDIQLFNKYGYVPSDKSKESVSKTLEYSYDDWCIAQMAQALNKPDDFREFSKRAHNYQNLYDASTGFMRPKLASGEWEKPFDPRAAPTDFSKRNFTEANAWQYLWYVPQDIPDLMHLMGGRASFVARLDTLFNTSPHINEGGISDMSGLIGQYVQGNEPDQQTPYLYDYAGAPWKTQQVVHTIMDSLYNDTPAGLPGNEDCGQMSAWYVFSALGFYPVNPANGVYAIGSPVFPTVTIHLSNGNTFTVKADGVSDDKFYIQSAKLNNQTYNKPFITYQDIRDGGTLTLKMGTKPNKKWAAGEQEQPPITAFTKK